MEERGQGMRVRKKLFPVEFEWVFSSGKSELWPTSDLSVWSPSVLRIN
jgi:hypothetical protein